jgi:hypothetical protein
MDDTNYKIDDTNYLIRYLLIIVVVLIIIGIYSNTNCDKIFKKNNI